MLRRGACHRARIRATRWLLAMTNTNSRFNFQTAKTPRPSLRALAKQSIARIPQFWIASLRQVAPRNDVKTKFRALAARCARVVYASFPRKQRAQGMPGARRARSLACEIKKHTSIVTTVTPVSPGIPCAMVYGLFRALPGDRAFLPPSLAELPPRT